MAAAVGGAPEVRYIVCDNACTPVTALNAVAPTTSFGSRGYLNLYAAGGLCVLVVSVTNGDPNSYLEILVFQPGANALLGPALVLQGLAGGDLPVSSHIGPNVLMTVFNSQGNSTFRSLSAIARSSIFGIAQEQGAPNATIKVRTKGTFVLPPSQPLVTGGIFDSQNNTVPGNRGMVTGNVAELFGLKPT